MGWMSNREEKPNQGAKIRFLGTEGRVDRTYPSVGGFVAVDLNGLDYLVQVYYLELEVWEEEPKPPAYLGTDYYQEVSTGAVYRLQYQAKTSKRHLVCATSILPSIEVGSHNRDSDLPEGFKRFYREV